MNVRLLNENQMCSQPISSQTSTRLQEGRTSDSLDAADVQNHHSGDKSQGILGCPVATLRPDFPFFSLSCGRVHVLN